MFENYPKKCTSCGGTLSPVYRRNEELLVDYYKHPYRKITDQLLRLECENCGKRYIIVEEERRENMEINFNGKIEDISMMLLSAERYALGRQTYIVQWTCEVIGGNTHLITTKDLKVMIRDIENAEYYGADFDKKEWLELLDILKLILSKSEAKKDESNDKSTYER